MGSHYSQLVLKDRIEIYRLHADGKSQNFIADFLGCHKSTIGRELRRNSLKTKVWMGGYDPERADLLADRRRRWDGRFKLARQPSLLVHVKQHLAMGWSPEQIAGRLALEKASITISHEAIYRFIYHRVGQSDYLNRLLRHAKYRRGRMGMRGGNPINLIKDRVSIDLRPSIIASRRRFGDWECDGMGFRGNHHFVLVAHERKSRFVAAFRQPNRTAATTAETLISLFKSFPQAMARSSTFDNGSEFFHHHKLNQECNMATYFCDTHSPWQKGAIENTNGRLRRYLPTKLNPNELSQQAFDAIIANHNNTPRKCLGFKTPAELFNQQLNKLHFNRESTPQLSPG